MGFPFLFALCACAGLVIWFAVDVEKGRRDAVRFAREHRSADGTHAKATVGADADGYAESVVKHRQSDEDPKVIKSD